MLAHPRVKRLLSSEHVSVDGTLIEAWASPKSLAAGRLRAAARCRPHEQDFHGQKRRNDTHASTTDPEAQRYRKGRGKEAKLSFMGQALMENRNRLIVGVVATRASGHAERLAARHLVAPYADRPNAVAVGGDKGFDTQDFVAELREVNATPQFTFAMAAYNLIRMPKLLGAVT